MRRERLADLIVLGLRERAQLQHLPEHEHESPLLPLGDGGGGFEPRQHRGAIRVVGIVQQERAARESHEVETPVAVRGFVDQIVEHLVEHVLGHGRIEESAGRSHSGQGRVDAGLAQERGADLEVLPFEQRSSQGELPAVLFGGDLAEHPEIVRTTTVGDPLRGARAT